MARVFSQKHSSTYVGNGGIYSVDKESVYQIWQFSKTECFASISWKCLTCETLAKTNYLHPVLTFCIPVMCKAHTSLRLTNKSHINYISKISNSQTDTIKYFFLKKTIVPFMINFLNLSLSLSLSKKKNKKIPNFLHVKNYPMHLCITTQIQVFNNSIWGGKKEEDAFSW